MGMRRRPLARVAVVGGVAHHAGKKSAEAAAAEQAQNEEIADLQAQPQAAAPPAQAEAPADPVGGSDDMVAELTNLKKLLDEGILTQAEFDLEKQKILTAH
jgi:hypothetical protein